MATFGRTPGQHGNTFDANPSGYKVCRQYTAAAGPISKLVGYWQGAAASGSQKVRGFLYTVSASNPAALIGVTDEITVVANQVAAEVDMPFSNPPNPGAIPVFMGIHYGDGTANVAQIGCDGTGGDKYQTGDTYADGPSDPFGTPTGTTGGHSNYALYGVTVDAPLFRNAAQSQTTTASLTLAATNPTIVTGDQLIAYVYNDVAGSTAGASITAPAGWTQLYPSTDDASGTLTVFTRTATGTEGATTTFTASVSAHIGASILAYSGASGLGSWQATSNTTGNTATTATITTTGAPRTIVSGFFKNGNNGVTDSWSSTGATQRVNFLSTTAEYLIFGIFDELQQVAGPISRTATLAANDPTNAARGNSTIIISLIPAGVAGAPVNTAAPQMSGTPQVAAQLSVTTGGWTNTPTSYGYQWQSAAAGSSTWANIAGATSATYTAVAGDQGRQVRAAVTATNASGSSAPAYSNAATIAAPAAPPPAGLYGQATSGVFHSRTRAQRQTEMTDMASGLGSTWIRLNLWWSVAEATAKGTFTWTVFDEMVQDAGARGLKVLFTFAQTPGWARVGGSGANSWTHPVNNADAAAFLTAAVNRYKPGGTLGLTSTTGVSHWEIWNEPNLIGFWPTGPNAAEYAAMLIACYNAIKGADSGATVVSAGLAPYGYPTGYGQEDASGINPLTYLERMYAAGAGTKIDAVGWHPYCSDGFGFLVWSAWSQLAETSPSARSIMVANGDNNKPIWITEYGNDVPTWCDEPTGAARVTEVYQRAAAFAFPHGPVFYYAHRALDTNGGQGDFSLVDNVTLAPRQRYTAYANSAKGAVSAVPANTSPPTISGSAVVGNTLVANPGTWSNNPTSYAYQWLRNGVTIAGAVNQSYVIGSSDSGAALSVRVTASNSVGAGIPATSAATAVAVPGQPVNTVLPVITGITRIANVLSATTGQWTNSPISYTFRWLRANDNGAGAPDDTSWAVISGATFQTYTQTLADVGKWLTVEVVAST